MVHVLRPVSNTLFSFLSINHITDALPLNYDVINVVKHLIPRRHNVLY